MVFINGDLEDVFFESFADSFAYAVMADGLVPHDLNAFLPEFCCHLCRANREVRMKSWESRERT